MPLFRRTGSRRDRNGSALAPPTEVKPAAVSRRPGGGGPAHAAGHPWDESRVRDLGGELLERARGKQAGVLSKRFWSDKLMDWSMKDRAFKVEFFRFVDAFPVLRRSPKAVVEHLRDSMSQPGVKPPPGMELGLKAGNVAGFAQSAFAKTVAGQIESMGRTFIAGVDAADALPTLEKLWTKGVAFSVDLLGEACIADAEADAYRERYLDLVRELPERVGAWKGDDRLERDHLGAVPRTNVSVKISSLSARSGSVDPESAIADLMPRLVPILEAARERGVFINFDMEHVALKPLTIELFKRCCERVEFEGGIALQAYLRSGDEDARDLAAWAESAGRRVTVRLVKGAYWDHETIHAEEMGWPCPVWSDKRATDACFERMSEIILDATPTSVGEGGLTLALGSHNARSIGAALEGLERRGLPRSAIELQMLHGMADELKVAAAAMGLRVREYVPVGEMIPGMAYLVRRLLENTSNESWLKAGFLEGVEADALLASPHDGDGVGAGGGHDLADHAAERHALSPAVEGVGDGRAFVNEPTRDFAVAAQRQAFAQAVASARLPDAPVAVSDDDEPEVKASCAVAMAEMLGREWAQRDASVRANALIAAADEMRRRRDELAGMIVKEVGKPWRDADAEVCEAIDFCAYYARLAPRLFERERLGRFIGELDEQWYQPRGVCAVIAPWNFPLAICCGMTAAALVTGNGVVVKPAEQSSRIAAELASCLIAGVSDVDDDVHGMHLINLLAGRGETVGAALVRDYRVSVIAFTGSQDVGLDIIRAAAEDNRAIGQGHVKKVVCEMGGKNAIIVDTSADLDEAVVGVRDSAFGFAGQKCSACSRCIVVDPDGPDGAITRAFTERLIASTRSLVVGDPMDSATDVGPVIDEAAAAKIRGAIEQATEEIGPPALRMDDLTLSDESPVIPKRVIGPTIFAGVEPGHRLARVEVFGPALAVMHASTFQEAIEIANNSPYKLTGGVYTRRPSHLEAAKRTFRVGNLYLNRGITGALIARQPFGGFGLSGVGSKAGGRDYLLQFVEPRASAENTMRRGFAPEL